MARFKAIIRETLCKEIDIEAESEEQAEHKAIDMYEDSEVILSPEDFVGVDIMIESISE